MTEFEDPEIPDPISEDFAAEPVDWGSDELEAAYLKAMSALEASDAAMPEPPLRDGDVLEAALDDLPSYTAASEGPESATLAVDRPESSVPGTVVASTFSTPNELPAPVEPTVPPAPRQILEACLFVGGGALTAERLAGILRNGFDAEFIDREIDELNRIYAAENRPYEIRLGEGGYRLTLREEYERIRYKVYGLGPKEVRLSQEALEVLAVVAYHQPITQKQVEELGKPGCGSALRQLVRRELLAIERSTEKGQDVRYKTTSRFLSLFGIQNLDELPRHEQISYK